MANVLDKLGDISTFIFDVDGVMTDGSLFLPEDGPPSRVMNAKDGMAMKIALDKGYKMAIITGGYSDGVINRFQRLGIKEIYTRVEDKVAVFNKLLSIFNIKAGEVLYMGDDVNDVGLLKQVGLPCCPYDAVPETIAVSDYVSPKNGGKGCVRDVIEKVLKVQENWV